MTLSDALLLDPVAPPRVEVWIALRGDGLKGSGTEEDPFDASYRANPVLSVSSITFSTTLGVTTATVTCTSHGYSNGNIVVMSGATGDDGSLYNGTFQISGVTTNTFQYTMLDEPAANAAGTLACALDPYRFDAVMRSLGTTPVAVRIGPGTFLTKGFNFALVASCWQPASGWRIAGSGIDVTVLKLVEAAITDVHYWAVGNNVFSDATRLNGFELSDLTIDCNMSGQPVPAGKDFAELTCGAVLAGGSHIRIRCVRAINFGRQGAPECFVFNCADANPNVSEAVDCVVEDCIIEQPSLNGHRESTCILMGAEERRTDGIMAYHRACVVRNCLVDCEYRDNPVAISQINFSGTTATVTTVKPHGRVVNDWVRVSGALVNGSAANPYNGSFKITAVTPPSQFQYTMVATPTAQPLGDMWVGRFPSHLMAISNLTATQIGMTNEYEVVITTAAPHFRVPGNNVSVGDVYVNGIPPILSDKYNGSFKVLDVTPWNPLTLKYKITSASNPGPWYGPTGYIGASYQAVTIDGGTSAVAEGNRMFNCFIGGPYHDTWNTKDLTVRNNHFRAVQTGPYQNLGTNTSQLGDPSDPAKSWLKYHNSNPLISFDRIKRTGDGKTALFTTQYDHGYTVGQAVKISGVFVGGNPDNHYIGYFAVESVPAANQFTYRMTGDPISDADPSPIPQFATLWQVRSLTIENNLIELASSATGYFNYIGIQVTRYQGDPSIGSQRVVKRAVIRGNVIRHVDGVYDPNPYVVGIRLFSTEYALIEDNVVDLASPNPIQHLLCDRVEYFNNRTPSGRLIQGVEIDTSGNVITVERELTTEVEGALILAF